MTERTDARSPSRPGRTLGTTGGWRHRLLLHHLPLALLTAAALALLMGAPVFTTGSYIGFDMGADGLLPQPREDSSASMGGAGHDTGAQGLTFSTSQLTMATGYVATVLLGLTLLIGPVNLLLRRRNPVSSYLRRDLGTWTVLVSVLHVIFGLQLHSGGAISGYLRYFVPSGEGALLNSFRLGNWTGLAATVTAVGLLAISTDRSMRELRAKRWKNLQRLNYALFALVVLHAFFYGALLRATSPFTLVLIGTVSTVLTAQLIGIRLWRRRQPHVAGRQRERARAGDHPNRPQS